MRKTILASVLVLALCGSAYAGDIESPPLRASDDAPDTTLVVPEEPAPPSATPSPDDLITYGLTEAALTALNNVLALF